MPSEPQALGAATRVSGVKELAFRMVPLTLVHVEKDCWIVDSISLSRPVADLSWVTMVTGELLSAVLQRKEILPALVN